MREVTFKPEKGKEIPDRLDGTEIRYTLPTTIDEIMAPCGGNAEVVVSVFNEGYNLNHRQKIAKRFAARENSTADTILAGVLAHVPGVRPIGDGTPRVSSARKQVEDMLAELQAVNPELAAKYAERLAAIAPKAKAKAVDGTTTETATPAAPVAETVAAQPKANHKR